MSDPFKEREVRLTVQTRHSGTHCYNVEEKTAKTVMVTKCLGVQNLLFFHSGGVIFYEANDVIAVQMHGTSMAHSEQLLTEVMEMLK